MRRFDQSNEDFLEQSEATLDEAMNIIIKAKELIRSQYNALQNERRQIEEEKKVLETQKKKLLQEHRELELVRTSVEKDKRANELERRRLADERVRNSTDEDSSLKKQFSRTTGSSSDTSSAKSSPKTKKTILNFVANPQTQDSRKNSHPETHQLMEVSAPPLRVNGIAGIAGTGSGISPRTSYSATSTPSTTPAQSPRSHASTPIGGIPSTVTTPTTSANYDSYGDTTGEAIIALSNILSSKDETQKKKKDKKEEELRRKEEENRRVEEEFQNNGFLSHLKELLPQITLIAQQLNEDLVLPLHTYNSGDKNTFSRKKDISDIVDREKITKSLTHLVSICKHVQSEILGHICAEVDNYLSVQFTTIVRQVCLAVKSCLETCDILKTESAIKLLEEVPNALLSIIKEKYINSPNHILHQQQQQHQVSSVHNSVDTQAKGRRHTREYRRSAGYTAPATNGTTGNGTTTNNNEIEREQPIRKRSFNITAPVSVTTAPPKIDSTRRTVSPDPPLITNSKQQALGNGKWTCKCGAKNESATLHCVLCKHQRFSDLDGKGWQCSKCTSFNPTSVTKCKTCGSALSFTSKGWKCTCLYVNKMADATCAICQKPPPNDTLVPKPSPSPSPARSPPSSTGSVRKKVSMHHYGHWRCGICKSEYPVSVVVCEKCNEPQTQPQILKQ